MKNFVKAAAAAAVLGLASGGAHAAGSHTVNVSATVAGVCIVSGANASSTLAFGTIDGTPGNTYNAVWSSATGNFRCTSGTTYTITSNDGLWETSAGGANNRMKLSTAADCSTASNCIRYTMTNRTTGVGAGLGTDISFNVTGQTSAADLVTAPAGSYSDTVTLTVSP